MPKKSRRHLTTSSLEEQEKRLVLAVKDYKNGVCTNVSELARKWNVPRSSLDDRLKGKQSRVKVRENSHKLTANEEKSLCEDVLEKAARGVLLRAAEIRDMANSILALRRENPVQKVGEKWAYNFINREKKLKSVLRNVSNRKRAFEDKAVFEGWFDRVKCIFDATNFESNDIYSVAETAFKSGLAAITNTSASSIFGDISTLPKTDQVIAIECANPSGYMPPPFVFSEGDIFKSSVSDEGSTYKDWKFRGSSENTAVHWLENHFIPLTAPRLKGTHRLLIINGIDKNGSSEFKTICENSNVVTLFVPPHLPHLLHPLNVGCFGVLHRAYAKHIKEKSETLDTIENRAFFEAFNRSRTDAYTEDNIKNGFLAAGIVPFDPTQVYKKLSGEQEKSKPILQDSSQDTGYEKDFSELRDLISSESDNLPGFVLMMLDRLSSAMNRKDQELSQMMKQFDDYKAKHEQNQQDSDLSEEDIQGKEGSIASDNSELPPTENTTNTNNDKREMDIEDATRSKRMRTRTSGI